MRDTVLTPGYAVLLCAHNGAHFLEEQLDSIVRQSVSPACVFFFDDGSSDATSEVARRFSAALPLEFVHLSKRRPGAAGAFDALLTHAASDARGWEAYFLCDQDDIWEPEKAARLLDALAGCPAGKPALVHSELRCFGSAAAGREFLHESLGHRAFESTPDQPLQTLLFENVVVGASTAFNHALLSLAIPMPLEAYMHDWWLAVACTAHGGTVRYLAEPLTRYRIHGASTVGRSGRFLHALPRRVRALGQGLADPWLRCVRDQLVALPFGPALPAAPFEPLLQDALTLFTSLGLARRYSAWRRLRQRTIWAVASKDAYYKARLLTDHVA